jgi:hypothetical protein
MGVLLDGQHIQISPTNLENNTWRQYLSPFITFKDLYHLISVQIHYILKNRMILKSFLSFSSRIEKTTISIFSRELNICRSWLLSYR